MIIVKLEHVMFCQTKDSYSNVTKIENTKVGLVLWKMNIYIYI